MTVLFTGGGTLGPVTPLLAVLQELRTQKHELRFVWVGTANGPEWKKLRLFPDVPFETVPIAKFDRFFSFRILFAPFVFLVAVVRSFFILLKYRPSAIIGAGAFTQVPLMWAGRVLRVPSLIHQQDVRVGLANRLCAGIAKVITVNFDITAKQFPQDKTKVVGNPVFIPSPDVIARSAADEAISGFARDNEIASQSLAMTKEKKPLLLVIGGGTGAEQLNTLVFLNADRLTTIFNIVLISGGRDIGRGGVYLRPHGADARPAPTGLHVTPFVDDTYHVLEKADLVVTRAGTATLTELASLGKPTLIIPIPHSHQVDNARYYRDHGAAEMMEIDYPETESKAKEFVEKLRGMCDNEEQRGNLSRNIQLLYRDGAKEEITFEILKQLVPSA